MTRPRGTAALPERRLEFWWSGRWVRPGHATELGRKARRLVLEGRARRLPGRVQGNGQRSQGQGSGPRLTASWEPAARPPRVEKQMVERFLGADLPECDGSRINLFAGTCASRTSLRGPDLGTGERAGGDAGEGGAQAAGAHRRDLLLEIERRARFSWTSGSATSRSTGGGHARGEAADPARASSRGAPGVLYVLDEPSIGLHEGPRPPAGRLANLRDAGNSVVIVEHDESTLRSADWLIDVGPSAGSRGGESSPRAAGGGGVSGSTRRPGACSGRDRDAAPGAGGQRSPPRGPGSGRVQPRGLPPGLP